MGQQSRFRADLFHRLNVLSIRVPPLSERADDLAPLTQHFLEKYRSLCCGWLPEVGADFLDALRQIALPGNVRQLEDLIRQALVGRRTDAPFGLNDLPAEAWRQLSESSDVLPTPQRESEASGGSARYREVRSHLAGRKRLESLSVLGALRGGGSRSGDAARSRQPERVCSVAWDHAVKRSQQKQKRQVFLNPQMPQINGQIEDQNPIISSRADGAS